MTERLSLSLLEKECQPTPVCFPGEFHGQRSLDGYSPWGRKELDTTEQLTLLYVKYKVARLVCCNDVFCNCRVLISM